MTVRRKSAAGRGVVRRAFISRSPRETEEIGRRLARRMEAPAVILLRGALGTGKTTLARGLACGLGLEDPARVHSPSFAIVNVYRGRHTIYHVDLYRLGGARDLRSVGLEDFLGRDGVTIVEWAERLEGFDGPAVVVELEEAGRDRRILRVHRVPRRCREGAAACGARVPGDRSGGAMKGKNDDA